MGYLLVQRAEFCDEIAVITCKQNLQLLRQALVCIDPGPNLILMVILEPRHELRKLCATALRLEIREKADKGGKGA
jgi:hypothetical protein